jgi:hypothetical protein
MRTAPSNRGGCVGEISGKTDNPSDTAAHRSAQPLSDDYRAARDRVAINARLCQWLLDLTGRIKQTQADLAYGDFSRDPRELQAEFERLKLAITLHKRGRR